MMESLDLRVLNALAAWRAAGRQAWLATVVQTWGSAPRPPGALAAFCDDGRIVGSVSGGCVEDELADRLRGRALAPSLPEVVAYGAANDAARRFPLPCGGTLRLVVEPVADAAWVGALATALARREAVARRLDLATGLTQLVPAEATRLVFDGRTLVAAYGPRWRLVLIGASEVARSLADIAPALDYEVLVCDAREDYRASWDLAGVPVAAAMPDDFVLAIKPDARTIILALSHDPKHDDLALLEALESKAYYVGAMGAKASHAGRLERLASFGLSVAQLGRLRGPVGLAIGSRTPPEIAIAVLAELTALRNGIEFVAPEEVAGTSLRYAAA